MRDATETLMDTINHSTTDMSNRIREGLGFKSNIQIPKDLRDLFSALDFSTKYSGYDIPLQKRGDGIQARHIPFILDFIARRSKKHHIWAYEEPENSLELSRAFELAKQFNSEFCTENQIYLTTHSPAFYDLKDTHVSKWKVSSQLYKSGPEICTEAEKIGDNIDADKMLGLAALIADRARELYEEIDTLEHTNAKLNDNIAQSQLPQVIVEGPTDKTILQIAFSKLYPGQQQAWEYISASGCSNLTVFLKGQLNISHNVNNVVIGLYDNDKAGTKEYKTFNNYQKVPTTEFRALSTNKNLYCGQLPIPTDLQETLNLVPENQLPLPIEFMFPAEVISSAEEQGVLRLKERTTTAKDHELSIPINLTLQFIDLLGDDKSHFAFKIDDDTKSSFAEWVEVLEPEKFQNFEEHFRIIELIIEHADSNQN